MYTVYGTLEGRVSVSIRCIGASLAVRWRLRRSILGMILAREWEARGGKTCATGSSRLTALRSSREGMLHISLHVTCTCRPIVTAFLSSAKALVCLNKIKQPCSIVRKFVRVMGALCTSRFLRDESSTTKQLLTNAARCYGLFVHVRTRHASLGGCVCNVVS